MDLHVNLVYIGCISIVILLTGSFCILLSKMSSIYRPLINVSHSVKTNMTIPMCNYFMPERVPTFLFNGQAKKLVELLDELSKAETKETKQNSITRILTSIDLNMLYGDLDAMENFELECLHCVNSWLLHLIRFEFSIYLPKLKWIAATVARRLNVNVGGCSNVSFTYNWQHIRLKPNSVYDCRTLQSEDLVPRFRILSDSEGDSLWYFIKGHILMEARACNIFHGIIKLYSMEQDSSLIEVRETLAAICLEMKTILSVMSTYMHKNKVFLQHWPIIQELLKLPLYNGIRGLQNCWIFAMNFIVNVKKSDNEEINAMENAVWESLLPHQIKWMSKFKENSDTLMALCKHHNDNELYMLFEEFIRHIITWRAIHRSRASQFISSTLNDTYETTGSGKHKRLLDIQNLWDQRINDFSKLKQTIRVTRYLPQLIRTKLERNRVRSGGVMKQRASLHHDIIQIPQVHQRRLDRRASAFPS